jgi:hypothetical protein
MAVTGDRHNGIKINYNLLSEQSAIFNFFNSLGQQILTLHLPAGSRELIVPVELRSQIYLYSVSNSSGMLAHGKVFVY